MWKNVETSAEFVFHKYFVMAFENTLKKLFFVDCLSPDFDLDHKGRITMTFSLLLYRRTTI